MDNEYLTIEETANLLKMSTGAIRNLCRTGKLPAKRFPPTPRGHWRISLVKLKKILP